VLAAEWSAEQVGMVRHEPVNLRVGDSTALWQVVVAGAAAWATT
jgi:hypothetical protein